MTYVVSSEIQHHQQYSNYHDSGVAGQYHEERETLQNPCYSFLQHLVLLRSSYIRFNPASMQDLMRSQSISYCFSTWTLHSILVTTSEKMYSPSYHQSFDEEYLETRFHFHTCLVLLLCNLHSYPGTVSLPFCSKSMLFWRKSLHSCPKWFPVFFFFKVSVNVFCI